jgi:branched-chain amino acid transport system ATP-binding protein
MSAIDMAANAPVSAGALLTADGLSAGYHGVPVIRDLNLEVRPGEIVAILGANGAGKTTTLRALCGVIPTSAGTVSWLGRPVHSPLHVRCREGLAYVPEERSIIPSLSVVDNLRLGRGEVEAAFDIIPDLRPLQKRQAGLLSGGEQQMLTLARALAAEPTLLVVDELSLGLGPRVVERLLTILRTSANRGLGVALVEQQVRTALEIADRAYVLQRGMIVMSATSAQLENQLDQVESVYLTGIRTE